MIEQYVNDLKQEMAQILTRIENTEGYFDNFDTTLNNHMTDYNRKLSDLRNLFKWGFWIVFTLLVLVMGSGGALLVMLAQQYLRLIGG